MPALAVAEQLRRLGAHVTFIGGARAEAELVPAAGFPLLQLPVIGLSRTNPLRAAQALASAGASVVIAHRMLSRLGAHAVMGAGGYASGPVGLAALLARRPLVLTEADSRLGLANRLLAPYAHSVCLAFPITEHRPSLLSARVRSRCRVTGRPVFTPQEDRQRARERFALRGDAPCVLVFGGSLGARSINLAAIDGLAGLAPRIEVLHISGRREYRQLLTTALPEGYQLIEYLERDELALALCACDLVVSRAGGSLFEVAAHGKPAVLVPYPQATADHQTANAAWMTAAGAALTVPDVELTGSRLASEVLSLIESPGALEAMAAASAALAKPNAAQEVAEELLAAAAGTRPSQPSAERDGRREERCSRGVDGSAGAGS